MDIFHRTYCVVSPKIIKDNFLKMKACVPKTVKMLAVIKADAYGHGSLKTAQSLSDVADYFGVATIDEALELRSNNINKKILILGYTLIAQYPLLLQYDIIPVIYTYEDALKLNEVAKKQKKKAVIHIAVDTGMSRIGFQCDDEGIAEANKIFDLPFIEVEGAFSHFAKADEYNKSFTAGQNAQFIKFLSGLKKPIPVKHIANSAGIIDFTDYRYDMVRAGISMYGYAPSSEVDMSEVRVKPALEWHAHVTHVKELQPGRVVSYGGTFRVKVPTKVATVSVGYADGYPRALSNKGTVIINGEYAPILGRVCMDQMMVDVTDIPDVVPETDVILLGTSGKKSVTADEMARICGTISYEIICGIGKRVPRVYKN